MTLICASGFAQSTARVSVDSNGTQANNASAAFSLSPDGRFVVFSSSASNLVPGDTNGKADIFVRDLLTGATSLVSVSPNGTQGNQSCDHPSTSADGRFVVFDSLATNLLPGDTNNATDIFVRDRQSGTTTRVSVASSGAQGNNNSFEPTITADGRYVVFDSVASNLVLGDTNGKADVFVRDLTLGTTRRVSVSSSEVQADESSWAPTISADGRFVAFYSYARNLVPGDTVLSADIFVRDLVSGATTRASVDPNGAQANNISTSPPSLSADGHFVVFTSTATNLVAGDTNNVEDVFVRDLLSGITTRVSVDSNGVQGNQVSADLTSISADGRYVAFESGASNLVPGDTNNSYDIFVRDLQGGTTRRVSVNSAGAQSHLPISHCHSFAPKISVDGRVVAFFSNASDLVNNDTNSSMDVFVHDDCQITATYCTAKLNSLGCTPSIVDGGCASASASHGFVLRTAQVRNAKSGFVIYGVSGRAAVPFQGGTLCVQAPIARTPIVNSGGTPLPANDCSGVYAIDMNAFASGSLGGNPLAALGVSGTTVDCQWYGRDPGFIAPNNSTLSDALEYVVGP